MRARSKYGETLTNTNAKCGSRWMMPRFDYEVDVIRLLKRITIFGWFSVDINTSANYKYVVVTII